MIRKVLAASLAIMMLFAMSSCGANAQVADVEKQETNNDTDIFEIKLKGTSAKIDEIVLNNQVYNENVYITGDFGSIIFVNCEFNKDVVLTSNEYTRVIFTEGSKINGKCIIKSTIQEADVLTYYFPKFISDVPFEVECENLGGAYMMDVNGSVKFNGQEYNVSDVEHLVSSTYEFIPYNGEALSGYMVAQYWENGEKQIELFGEQ